MTKVKNKVAFNLTPRQLICFGGGGLIGVPLYFLTRGTIGNEPAALLMIGLMLPFFLFGIYEKDGQPLEKVLGHFIRARFICPQTRPYRTENFYAALGRQQEVSNFAKQKKSGKTRRVRKNKAPNRKG